MGRVLGVQFSQERDRPDSSPSDRVKASPPHMSSSVADAGSAASLRRRGLTGLTRHLEIEVDHQNSAGETLIKDELPAGYRRSGLVDDEHRCVAPPKKWAESGLI